MVVVKGIKKFSKDTGGWPATSLSRRRGLELISHVISSGFGYIPREMVNP
jgi:hypothetical protein